MRQVKILLVEDSKPIRRENERVLIQAGYEVICAVDGESALRFAHEEKPDLILLDLNLPRKDGREVLAEIRADEKLTAIPVVVLTTSQAELDVLRAYALHANCYITKPVDFRQFLEVVEAIESFWLTVVKLPPPNGTKVESRIKP